MTREHRKEARKRKKGDEAAGAPADSLAPGGAANGTASQDVVVENADELPPQVQQCPGTFSPEDLHEEKISQAGMNQTGSGHAKQLCRYTCQDSQDPLKCFLLLALSMCSKHLLEHDRLAANNHASCTNAGGS